MASLSRIVEKVGRRGWIHDVFWGRTSLDVLVWGHERGRACLMGTHWWMVVVFIMLGKMRGKAGFRQSSGGQEGF